MTTPENASRTTLLNRLNDLGIDIVIVDYPEHTTIEDGKRLRGNLPGTFTKNLLLKDKKGRMFFVTAYEDTDIDLKTLHSRIGAQGRLGFVSPEIMAERLQVKPGTATPLALFNDSDNAITLVVDAALEGAEQLNFHPMTHTESIGLSWPQFLSFVHSCNHAPTIVELGQQTSTSETTL